MVAGVFTWKELIWYAYLWMILTFILSIYFNAFMRWLEEKSKERRAK